MTVDGRLVISSDERHPSDSQSTAGKDGVSSNCLSDQEHGSSEKDSRIPVSKRTKNGCKNRTHRYTAPSPEISDMIAINFSCLRHRVPDAYHDVFLDRIMQQLNAPTRPVNMEKVPPQKIVRKRLSLKYEQKRELPSLSPKQLSYEEILNSDAAKKAAKYYQNLRAADNHKAELEREVNESKIIPGLERLPRGLKRNVGARCTLSGGRTRKPLANGQPSPLILDLRCQPQTSSKICNEVDSDNESANLHRVAQEKGRYKKTFAVEGKSLESMSADVMSIATDTSTTKGGPQGERYNRGLGKKNLPYPIKNSDTHNLQSDLKQSRTILNPSGSIQATQQLRVPHSKRSLGRTKFDTVSHDTGSRDNARIKQSDKESERLTLYLKGAAGSTASKESGGKLRPVGNHGISPTGVTTSCPLPSTRELSHVNRIKGTATDNRNQIKSGGKSNHVSKLTPCELHPKRFHDIQMQESKIQKDRKTHKLPTRPHVKKYTGRDIRDEIKRWFGCSLISGANAVKKYTSNDIRRELGDINQNSDLSNSESYRKKSLPIIQMTVLPPIYDHTSRETCSDLEHDYRSDRQEPTTSVNSWITTPRFSKGHSPNNDTPEQQHVSKQSIICHNVFCHDCCQNQALEILEKDDRSEHPSASEHYWKQAPPRQAAKAEQFITKPHGKNEPPSETSFMGAGRKI